MVDSLKVFTAPVVAGSSTPTANASLFQLPQAVSVGPG